MKGSQGAGWGLRGTSRTGIAGIFGDPLPTERGARGTRGNGLDSFPWFPAFPDASACSPTEQGNPRNARNRRPRPRSAKGAKDAKGGRLRVLRELRGSGGCPPLNHEPHEVHEPPFSRVFASFAVRSVGFRAFPSLVRRRASVPRAPRNPRSVGIGGGRRQAHLLVQAPHGAACRNGPGRPRS